MLKVSIIIATKNEEKNIGRCLESLISQSYKNLEIILIDFGSYDNTIEIAKKYTGLVLNIKEYVDLSKVKNFRGAQINFGGSVSKGEMLFFPDADMTFDKDLIHEIVNQSNYFDAFYIPEKIIGKGYFGKIRNFERSFYNETSIDAIRAIKKEYFFKVGGFDTYNVYFGPDDWDFTKMLKETNCKSYITKNFLYHHEESLNIKSYINKKSKYIYSFETYIKKWGKSDKDIKKQFGFYYRFLGVFIENGKWKFFFTHPILIISLFYIKTLVGIVFIIKKFFKLN